jgi:hypothetical protein
MKPLTLLTLATLLTLHLNATPVQFNELYFTGQPLNRKITLQLDPRFNPMADSSSTSVIGGVPLSVFPTNGTATVNLVPADYFVFIEGIPKFWRISVPDSTNVQNAVHLQSTLPSYAYTNAVGNTNGVQLAAGIWIIAVTNNGVVLISVNTNSVITAAQLAALAATNNLGSAAWQSISAFDPAGAAQAATNGLGSAARQPTSAFDPAGAAQAATNGLGSAARLPASAFDPAGAAQGAIGATNQAEFWVSTNALGTNGIGTMSAPFDGSTRVLFDSVMQAMPTNCVVHLMAGTYATWGDQGFQIKTEQRILGAGIDRTILKIVSDAPILSCCPPNVIRSTCTTCESGYPYLNSGIEVSDLTLDSNTQTNAAEPHNGIVLYATRSAIRRVKWINGFAPSNGNEAWGMCINGNEGAATGVTIEDCVVSQFKDGPLTGFGISVQSANHTVTGKIINNRAYLAGTTNMACIALSVCGGNGVEISGNYVEGAAEGFHADTYGMTNCILADNFFNGVGVGFMCQSWQRNQNRFLNNTILLDPTHNPATAFYSYGGSTNYSIIGNNIGLSGNAVPGYNYRFLVLANVAGLTISGNNINSAVSVGAIAASCTGTNFFANYDELGNPIAGLNTAFDVAGAAQAATNGLGSAARQSTGAFDSAGAAQTATNGLKSAAWHLASDFQLLFPITFTNGGSVTAVYGMDSGISAHHWIKDGTGAVRVELWPGYERWANASGSSQIYFGDDGMTINIGERTYVLDEDGFTLENLTISSVFKLSSGNPASGYVLTSDGSGTGTWQPPSASGTNGSTPAIGQVLTWTGSNSIWAFPSSGGTTNFDDIDIGTMIVTNLILSGSTPTPGQVITWSGAAAVWSTPSSSGTNGSSSASTSSCKYDSVTNGTYLLDFSQANNFDLNVYTNVTLIGSNWLSGWTSLERHSIILHPVGANRALTLPANWSAISESGSNSIPTNIVAGVMLVLDLTAFDAAGHSVMVTAKRGADPGLALYAGENISSLDPTLQTFLLGSESQTNVIRCLRFTDAEILTLDNEIQWFKASPLATNAIMQFLGVDCCGYPILLQMTTNPAAKISNLQIDFSVAPYNYVAPDSTFAPYCRPFQVETWGNGWKVFFDFSTNYSIYDIHAASVTRLFDYGDLSSTFFIVDPLVTDLSCFTNMLWAPTQADYTNVFTDFTYRPGNWTVGGTNYYNRFFHLANAPTNTIVVTTGGTYGFATNIFPLIVQ